MRLKSRLADSLIGETAAQIYLSVQYNLVSEMVPVAIAGANAAFPARNSSHANRIKKLERAEKPTIEHIFRHMMPDDTVWDIGADFGFYTCLCSDQLESGTVVAFEPYRPRVARLRLNLQHNDVACVIKKMALGACDGSLDGYRAFFNRSSPRIVAGDTLVESDEVQPPDVLKIDVDGGEWHVLDGLRNTLQDHVQSVYIEIHPKYLAQYEKSASDVWQLLSDLGFELSRIHDRPGEDNNVYYLFGKNNN